MADEHIAAAIPIPSFLIECLVWNVPDEAFGHCTYTADVRWVLAYLFNNTMSTEACEQWGEINDVMYLFHSSQPSTVQQAHAFTSAAWDYLAFE
ncbi:MAG: hypothetical protein AB7O65_09490 [Candidatus Korobacteraceae bacterium]